MTTIWLQPPDQKKPPVEVEYTRDKILPLMVKGHKQISPEEASERLKNFAAAQSPEPASPPTIWLKSPEGQTLEVQAVPDVLTPYLQKGWIEIPRT